VPALSATHGGSLESQAVDQSHATLPLDSEAIDVCIQRIGMWLEGPKFRARFKTPPAPPKAIAAAARSRTADRRLELEDIEPASIADLVALMPLAGGA